VGDAGVPDRLVCGGEVAAYSAAADAQAELPCAADEGIHDAIAWRLGIAWEAVAGGIEASAPALLGELHDLDQGDPGTAAPAAVIEQLVERIGVQRQQERGRRRWGEGGCCGLLRADGGQTSRQQADGRDGGGG